MDPNMFSAREAEFTPLCFAIRKQLVDCVASIPLCHQEVLEVMEPVEAASVHF